MPLEERDPETLTLEESRELVRRMRAREADAVKIKKEVKEEKRLSKRHRDSASVTDDGSGNDKFEDDVTMTASDRSRKRAKIQAIDLT